METRTVSRSLDTGSILALAGGALLIVGALLTWATVSVNVGNIAAAVGVDPSEIPPGVFPGPQSFAGTTTSDGKIALVCGVIALIAAMLLIMGTARKAAAVFLVLGGLAGGGVALYDGLTGKENAIEEGANALRAQGLPGDVKTFFDVSIGIGIWVCVAGGILVAVAGVMSLRSRGPATMGMQASGPPGTGTGGQAISPEPLGGMSAPSTPEMPPVPPTPPMDTPDSGSAPPTS